MLKKILCSAVLALLMLPASGLMAQTELINGIDAAYPPFAFIDKGEAKGFDIDMINWIAQKKGLNVVHKDIPWESIITTLKEKKINLIASGLSVTEERAQQVAFSIPYWKIQQVVLIKNDSTITLDTVLKGGSTIGLQNGTSDLASMEEAIGVDGRNYTIQGYQSANLAVEDLVNGRVDAVVMNNPKAEEFLPLFPIKVLGLAGIPEEEYAVAVSKDDPELLATINEGLTELMADPYWQELLKKWDITNH
ncbi:MAG: transporter substrate-binding domain-containing protein [Deltaproteobacteria bacterium]|nr:transporter substrate-binding domain-containing protein [Deltaproteobacteria bacterium]